MSTGAANLSLFLLAALPALGQSAQELLVHADRLRNPWPSYQVDVVLQEGRTRQRWRVVTRDNGDARVEGLSDKEAGRTVLLLGDQMWLLLPGTRRPVKVTPQQRLLGPASGGDIARFRFAQDYDIIQEAQDTLDTVPCRRLELKARRNALSFRTATLWISPPGIPILAEFHLPSGKLAKRARFRTQAGHPMAAMDIEDPSGKKTSLVFENWKPAHPETSRFQLPEDPSRP